MAFTGAWSKMKLLATTQCQLQFERWRKSRRHALSDRANQQASTARHTSKTPQNALRVKTNFTSRFNVIWVVQIARQKYTASTAGQISHISPRVSPN
jgi:hypothetical protein